MEPEMLKTIAAGFGGGGVIAALMWFFKDNRKERNDAVDAMFKLQGEQIESLKEALADSRNMSASMDALAVTVGANTAALQPLVASVSSMAGSVKSLSESVSMMVEDHRKDIDTLIEDHLKSKR